MAQQPGALVGVAGKNMKMPDIFCFENNIGIRFTYILLWDNCGMADNDSSLRVSVMEHCRFPSRV